jgi:hypothetical protein
VSCVALVIEKMIPVSPFVLPGLENLLAWALVITEAL